MSFLSLEAHFCSRSPPPPIPFLSPGQVFTHGQNSLVGHCQADAAFLQTAEGSLPQRA